MSEDETSDFFSEYSDYEEFEQKPVYDKYEFYSSDNVFLGYASKAKIKFYSKKQECCIVDHLTKKIIFNKPFDGTRVKSKVHYHKENICVICGDDYNLSITRIIPKYFCQSFPEEIKTGSENVISVCKECLNRVDKHIKSYQQKLYTEHNIDVEQQKKLNLLVECYKLAKTYVAELKADQSKTEKKKSEKTLRKLSKILYTNYLKQEYSHKIKITIEQLKNFIDDVEQNKIIDPKKDYLNGEVIKKTTDIKKFKENWIKNFFDAIETPYLPKIIN